MPLLKRKASCECLTVEYPINIITSNNKVISWWFVELFVISQSFVSSWSGHSERCCLSAVPAKLRGLRLIVQYESGKRSLRYPLWQRHLVIPAAASFSQFPKQAVANVPSTGVKKILISSWLARRTRNQSHFFHSWDGLALAESLWLSPSPRFADVAERTHYTLYRRMRGKRVHPIRRISLGRATYIRCNWSQSRFFRLYHVTSVRFPLSSREARAQALARETSPLPKTFCETMRNSGITNSFSQNFRFFFPSLAKWKWIHFWHQNILADA